MLLSDEMIKQVEKDTCIRLAIKAKQLGITHPNIDNLFAHIQRDIAKKQLAHSEPLIRADERAKVAQEIFEKIQERLDEGKLSKPWWQDFWKQYGVQD